MRDGVPRIVYRSQKKDAARLGGDDAKDRQLNRAWALYRRERQKLDHALRAPDGNPFGCFRSA